MNIFSMKIFFFFISRFSFLSIKLCSAELSKHKNWFKAVIIFFDSFLLVLRESFVKNCILPSGDKFDVKFEEIINVVLQTERFFVVACVFSYNDVFVLEIGEENCVNFWIYIFKYRVNVRSLNLSFKLRENLFILHLLCLMPLLAG